MSATRSIVEHSVNAANPVAQLFQGYDTFTGSARSTAVSGTVTKFGTSTDLYYKTCFDTESLMQALKISASVAVTYGPISGDAKTSFVRQLNLTTWSVTVLVYSHTVIDKATFTTVKLNAKPADDMDKFFKAYGDSFVSSLELGTEFAAAYVYYARSEKEMNELTASMQAHGVFAGGSVDASLATSLEQVTSSFSSQTTVSLHMGGVSGVPLPTPDQIIDFAMKFNTLAAHLPIVVSYGTTGYENVPGMLEMQNLVNNRRSFLGDHVSFGIARNIAEVATTLDGISLIDSVYQRYGYTGDTRLVANRVVLQDAYEALQGWIHLVEDSANTLHPAPVLDLPGTPVIAFLLKTPVTIGGNGGSEFPEGEDIDHSWVMNGTRLASIRLRGEGVVDRITLEYISSSNASFNFSHGGSGGSDGPPLSFQPGEFIAQIDGWHGVYKGNDVVHRAVIKTNFDQVMTWPLNPDSGKHVSLHVTEGAIVGFRGKSGRYVDQLQPVLAVFSPAIWKHMSKEKQ